MTGLSFSKSKKILSEYGVPFCKEKLVHSEKEAIAFLDEVDFPVILKIFSPEIPHITEVGGIKKNIRSKECLKRSWQDLNSLMKNKGLDKKLEGFLIQEQVSGVELVIGMKRSNEFGPVVMFGLGGVLVEVLKDVSFGVTPISKKEAKKMIKSIKAFKLLKGFRHYPKVDLDKVVDIIISISKLSLENENIKEIDLNPVIANDKKALVVDTSILYEKN